MLFFTEIWGLLSCFKALDTLMEFKIDTNETYTLLLPQTAVLDANLAALMLEQTEELSEEGVENFIFDMQQIASGDEVGLTAMATLHERCYEDERSLVFTGIFGALLQQFKKEQLHLVLNITPTLEEAIDMVNMEILERDLYNEEQP